MSETKLEDRHFPAGTIVHMNGIPVVLVTETNLETHPENWKLISPPKPEPEPKWLDIPAFLRRTKD